MEMDMEVESPRIVFLVQGVKMSIKKHLLSYIKVLDVMTQDVGKYLGEAIPITNEDTTVALMTTMVEFYEIYHQTLTKQPSASFFIDWILKHTKKEELEQLARIADYYGATELLFFTVDALYVYLHSMSPSQLERRYAQSIQVKRKNSDSSSTENRPLRAHYVQEMQINAILSTLLPYQLVRGIDRRIPKYPYLLTTSHHLTFIRDKEVGPPLLFRNYHYSLFAHPDGALSMKRGDKALHSGKVTEVSAGNIFMAQLDTEGAISLYGEITTKVVERPTFGNVSLGSSFHDERPFQGTCIAVWSGFCTIIALTSEGLYAMGIWNPNTLKRLETPEPVRLRNIDASAIIDVACGATRTLLLTRDGLYDYRGEGNEPILNDVNGEKNIDKIWAGETRSLALSTSGILYISADGGLYSIQRWRKVIPTGALGQQAKIDIISGSRTTTVVVVDNKIYTSSVTGSGGVSHFDLLRFAEGVIKEMVAHEEYILVATTTGFFVITENKRFVDIAFGGTDSVQSPYKLRINVEEPLQLVIPNKKSRISCYSCGAKAIYTDKLRSAFYCSGYCLHKSQ